MPITLDGTNGIVTPMYSGSITANAVTPVVSMKNKIINGNMFISQRGTSFTGVSLFAYTLDRMKAIISYTGGTTNVAQQSDAPDADSKYSIRYTHATANTSSVSDYCNRQSIETANICDLAGLSATVSFWYKSSRTGNHAVRVAPVGTTGGSATTTTFTVSAANTWEYKTVTTTAFVGVTAWGSDNAEGGYVDIGFNCGGTGQSAVSSGDYFAISRMQLEVGTNATSFDYRPYGTELALCQRYYVRYNLNNSAPMVMCFSYSTTGAVASAPLPVQLRAGPSSVESGNVQITNYIGNFPITSLTIGGGEQTETSVRLLPSVASGLTANQPYMIRGSGTGTQYVALNSEL